MNRNFILVLILLTTFSIINAVPHQLRKRKTKFVLCNEPAVEPIDVTVTPDPIVSKIPETYTVSGKLSHDIIAKKTSLVITYLDANGHLFISDLTLPFDKSYKAGEQFTFTAKDVPTPKLTKTYEIYVNIWDEKLSETIACAYTNNVKRLKRTYPTAERSYPIAERS